MKRNENFSSYRLHKLGTPKVLRTDTWRDGRSGPTTRPAFAKATQVQNASNDVNNQHLVCIEIPIFRIIYPFRAYITL